MLKQKRYIYTILVAAFVILSLVMNVVSVISFPVITGVDKFISVTRLDGSPLQTIELIWALPLAAIMMVVADLISEHFSKKEVILAIALGYLGGLLLSLWLMLGQALVGGYASNNFQLIIDGELVAHFFPWDALGQTWRFLIAGFVAYVLANFVNTGTMWLLKAKHGKNKLWFRVMLSTLFAQIIDNLLFWSIAFAPLGISALEKAWGEILLSVAVQVVLEVVIEAMVSPITIKLSKKMYALEA